MPILLFRGTVRPPIFHLNVLGLPKIRYIWPDQDLTVDFTIVIRESKLDVKCDATRFVPEEHLSMIAMHAHELSHAAIDSFCFFHGIGLTVFLEIFVDPEGKQTALTARLENVAELCTAFNLDPSYTGPDNYDAMIRLVVSDRFLLLALNDLAVSISKFNLATINCARAIEALRNSMTPPDIDRTAGWPIMREKLNLTKAYISFVTDRSAAPRHGSKRAPAEGDQSETLTRAWKIMNRFLEFRKRGSIALSKSEFPILDG
jgi:hypothetical protein